MLSNSGRRRAAHLQRGLPLLDVGPRGGPVHAVARLPRPSAQRASYAAIRQSPRGGGVLSMRRFADGLAAHGRFRRTKLAPLARHRCSPAGAGDSRDLDTGYPSHRYGAGPDNDAAMDDASDQSRLVKRGAGSIVKQFTSHTLRRLACASGIRLTAAPSKDSIIGSDYNDNECVA